MNPIPTKEQVQQWIADNPTLSAKRDIAKAFGIKGDARIDLKRLLRELEAEGVVQKTARSYREPGVLLPVAVLEVIGPDSSDRPPMTVITTTAMLALVGKLDDPMRDSAWP